MTDDTFLIKQGRYHNVKGTVRPHPIIGWAYETFYVKRNSADLRDKRFGVVRGWRPTEKSARRAAKAAS